MVSCSVPGCEVTRRNNPNQYTFNRFPRNSALFEKWMRIVNRPDWTPSTNSTICSKHFEGNCDVCAQSLMSTSSEILYYSMV
ncbi:hypothetical protein ABMA27_003622 [Loxostege sticticalis]|uniref:THAP-type domain-containing protein n=1 Tax=Loxostege sticticalis TaxID=481309 RepID=A0ABR3HPQ8_LOXSC